MKGFIAKTLFFLGVMLAVNALLFILVKLFYIRGYEEVDLNYPTYLLADSHGMPLGDFTEDFDVHNFSDHGDSYLDMERKLKYLIANTDVSKVYISVDDHTLSPYREDFNNVDRSAYYTELEDHQGLFDFLEEKYMDYYVVFLHDKYSLVIRNFLEKELFDFSKWKSQKKTRWIELSKEAQDQKSISRANDFFPGHRRSMALTTSLKNIISLCKENGIELIGVRFPLSQSFHKVIGSKSYRADEIFYKEGLLVQDYDSLYLGQDAFFRDQDHLEREVGAKFAEILFEGTEKD
ncbi:hypothetical protein P872_18740 [Rhodonellum psychrophilum GCM71 = DSM 17998]|uniref:Uncharacterized protein n=2 Tax=Rhodonellum TaxID=336827 RepID=U5BWW2_9BACT|nr:MULTISPECIES: hypothetical protein [Rhodonellum]ERM82328.1 hypothetical protein P872_18740 [Rhodonellum psychrophilum GCM71 = DSM 17998]SDZ48729.1 hypothetical protein SAMN05444412_11719 [Rhodonellum ikkaensis]